MANNAVLTGKITSLGRYFHKPLVKDVSGNVIIDRSYLDFIIQSGMYRITATAFGDTARKLHDRTISNGRLTFYGSPALRNHKLNMQVDMVKQGSD